MGKGIVLSVLIGFVVLGLFGSENVFADTLIAASGEQTPSHFSKLSITTGKDIQFLGNSGIEISGIDFSHNGKLYAATGGYDDEPGIYELSVTLEGGSSVATPIEIVSGLRCSDISFYSTYQLYCMTNSESGKIGLVTKSLYSVNIDTGNVQFIGTPFKNPDGTVDRTSGNGLAVKNGVIYYGNQNGLYQLSSGDASPTLFKPWINDPENSHCTRTNYSTGIVEFRGKSNGMDFDSSGTLYASFQCNFDPYLGIIEITTGKVTILGPLHSDDRVYYMPPDFRSGDMKTSALAFAPSDFDFLVGSTFGTVETAGVTGIINVVPNGDGVLVSTPEPVNVDLCDNSSLAIGIGGGSFNAECGSVTIQVVSGTVVAEFYAEDGSIVTSTLIKDDDVTFDEVLFSITNDGESDVVINVDGGDDITIPAGKTFSPGDVPPEPPATNEHYLSYKAKQPKGTDKFEKFDVTLDDQFESAIYTVDKPDRLYNPVQKWHDGDTTEIVDEISHYVGYKIKTPKGADKFDKVTDVMITNQFGDLIVDVKKAKLLLVPSAKDIIPTEPLDPVNIDHYKCYDAKETKHTPKFEKIIVSLYDPNFEIKQDFEVKKPKYLCTPVQKTLEDDSTTTYENPENYLMCYDVKKMKGADKFEKRNVFTNNQFGPEELKVEKQEELCVPSNIL